MEDSLQIKPKPAVGTKGRPRTKQKEIDYGLTPNQLLALKYWNDKTTREILYGGYAGGLKSTTLCLAILSCCFQYPGSRYFIARKQLDKLKKSTLLTLFEVAARLGVQDKLEHNQSSNIITVNTGYPDKQSHIFLMHLDESKDSNLDNWGSTEFTGGGIDECNQVSEHAKNIALSRCRYKTKDFGIIGKLFLTCNPSHNWVKELFWLPYTRNELQENRKFIPASAGDNPFLPDDYLSILDSLDSVNRERLLLGNWNYNSDYTLCQYDNVVDMFDLEQEEKDKLIQQTGTTTYLSIDPARMGQDKSVLIVWKDYTVVHIEELQKTELNVTLEKAKELISRHNIKHENVIVDVDGIGAGIADYISGCVKLNNNARALNEENYKNIKTQLYYRLAANINDDQIKFLKYTDKQKTDIIQELLAVKAANIDKDGKQEIISKEEIKRDIKRSPDYADAMAYRMYFGLQKGTATYEYMIVVGGTNRQPFF